MSINIINRQALTNVFHILGRTLGAILQGTQSRGIFLRKKSKETVNKSRIRYASMGFGDRILEQNKHSC